MLEAAAINSLIGKFPLDEYYFYSGIFYDYKIEKNFIHKLKSSIVVDYGDHINFEMHRASNINNRYIVVGGDVSHGSIGIYAIISEDVKVLEIILNFDVGPFIDVIPSENEVILISSERNYIIL